MMPSANRNPAANSMSSPGVRIVTERLFEPTRISSGSSTARMSSRRCVILPSTLPIETRTEDDVITLYRGPQEGRARLLQRDGYLHCGAAIRGAGTSSLFPSVAVGSAAWQRIFRAVPFPFDFDSALRCCMSKSRIGSRQWVLSGFAQHFQLHGDFLKGRSMCHRVRVAAGQNINRAFGGVHWHIEFPPVHAIGHHGAHAKLATPGGHSDQASALNTAFLGQFGRDFDEGVRRF